MGGQANSKLLRRKAEKLVPVLYKGPFRKTDGSLAERGLCPIYQCWIASKPSRYEPMHNQLCGVVNQLLIGQGVHDPDCCAAFSIIYFFHSKNSIGRCCELLASGLVNDRENE